MSNRAKQKRDKGRIQRRKGGHNQSLHIEIGFCWVCGTTNGKFK